MYRRKQEINSHSISPLWRSAIQWLYSKEKSLITFKKDILEERFSIFFNSGHIK